jgi:hypothetical protein
MTQKERTRERKNEVMIRKGINIFTYTLNVPQHEPSYQHVTFVCIAMHPAIDD